MSRCSELPEGAPSPRKLSAQSGTCLPYSPMTCGTQPARTQTVAPRLPARKALTAHNDRRRRRTTRPRGCPPASKSMYTWGPCTSGPDSVLRRARQAGARPSGHLPSGVCLGRSWLHDAARVRTGGPGKRRRLARRPAGGSAGCGPSLPASGRPKPRRWAGRDWQRWARAAVALPAAGTIAAQPATPSLVAAATLLAAQSPGTPARGRALRRRALPRPPAAAKCRTGCGAPCGQHHAQAGQLSAAR